MSDFLEPSQNQEQERLDFPLLWVTIQKKVLWILGAAVLGAGIALVLTNLFFQPVYNTKTTLIKLDKNLSLTRDLYQDQRIGTLQYAIKIPKILEQTIQNLDLNMTAAELARYIDVTTVTRTNVLDITVTHPDSDLVARLANEVANVFIHSPQNLEGVVLADDEILKQQKVLVKQDLEKLQQDLTQLKEKNHVNFFEQVTTLQVENLYALKLELSQEQLAFLKNQTQILELRKQISQLPKTTQLSETLSFQKLSDYQSLQRQLSSERKKYTLQNPKIRALQAQIESLEQELNMPQGQVQSRQIGPNPILAGLQIKEADLASETLGSQQKISALKQKISVLESELHVRSDIDLNYQDLKRQMTVKETVLSELELKLVESELSHKLSNNRIFDILQLAQTPTNPKLSKSLLMALTGVGGGLAGLALCLLFLTFREATDDRIKSKYDYSHLLRLRLLGVISDIHTISAELFQRQIQLLTVNLAKQIHGIQSKELELPALILVCSQTRSEGKSFLLEALKQPLLNKHIRSLIIDCNESEQAELPPLERPLLNEYFDGSLNLIPESAGDIYQVNIDALKQAYSINPESVSRLKKKFAGKYDVVFMAMPSLDAQMYITLDILEEAQALILMHKFRHVRRDTCASTLEYFQQLEACPPIFGLLNQVEAAYQNV